MDDPRIARCIQPKSRRWSPAAWVAGERNLTTGIWTDMSEPVAGTVAVIEFTAPYNPIDPRRFYRLLISR